MRRSPMATGHRKCWQNPVFQNEWHYLEGQKKKHNSLSGTIGMGMQDGSRFFSGPMWHKVLKSRKTRMNKELYQQGMFGRSPLLRQKGRGRLHIVEKIESTLWGAIHESLLGESRTKSTMHTTLWCKSYSCWLRTWV